MCLVNVTREVGDRATQEILDATIAGKSLEEIFSQEAQVSPILGGMIMEYARENALNRNAILLTASTILASIRIADVDPAPTVENDWNEASQYLNERLKK